MSAKSRKIKNYENVALDPDKIEGVLDFNTIFTHKDQPVEIEIGSGKGTFLVHQTQKFTETNFIGIEWAKEFYKYAVDRLGRWNIENVRMLRADAAQFIQDHISQASITRYHIYFPDPWPKKRHHKRRFICKDSLLVMHKTLIPHGVINIATDHADYFQWMLEHIDACGDIFEKVDYTPTAGAKQGEVAGTNFERKYLKEGRKVYTTAIKKV